MTACKGISGLQSVCEKTVCARLGRGHEAIDPYSSVGGIAKRGIALVEKPKFECRTCGAGVCVRALTHSRCRAAVAQRDSRRAVSAVLVTGEGDDMQHADNGRQRVGSRPPPPSSCPMTEQPLKGRSK